MKPELEHRKYYNKSGEEIPSVTTVLKIYGKDLTGWANWLGFQGIKVKPYVKERANYGTYVHSLAERYFTGDLSVLKNTDRVLGDEEYDGYMKKFEYLSSLLYSKGFVVYKCELPLEGERCGGTLDIIFYNETLNKYLLLDFKTSKAIQKSMYIQLGGYTRLLKEVLDIDVFAVGIILITKDTTDPSFSNIMSVKDNDKNMKIFDKLLDIYYLLDDKDKELLKGD